MFVANTAPLTKGIADDSLHEITKVEALGPKRQARMGSMTRVHLLDEAAGQQKPEDAHPSLKAGGHKESITTVVCKFEHLPSLRFHRPQSGNCMPIDPRECQA